ncbi:hypothetical protein RRG08_064671 [Elysia crispata]|uniref:G-protein coupled receptors family 3 profile domain-containing protein n=1 Tax=Elysia crispata TaxID=231223 RepID=A0AAE1CMP5_9GAST|nr:hypothetical protein RRG08_064671 [Elysia crispata]
MLLSQLEETTSHRLRWNNAPTAQQFTEPQDRMLNTPDTSLITSLGTLRPLWPTMLSGLWPLPSQKQLPSSINMIYVHYQLSSVIGALSPSAVLGYKGILLILGIFLAYCDHVARGLLNSASVVDELGGLTFSAVMCSGLKVTNWAPVTRYDAVWVMAFAFPNAAAKVCMEKQKSHKGILLIFGIFLPYETMRVRLKQFNDSRFVGMSIYNVVRLCVITASISLIFGNQENLTFDFVCLAIVLCSILSMGLFIVPEMKEILQHLRRDSQMVKSLTASLVNREEGARHQQRNLNDNEQFKKQMAEMED